MRAGSRSLVIILLAIIVFVIGGLVWIFLGGYVELQSECLTIVDYKDFTLVVRNCGKTYISDFQISINNELVQTEETDRSLRPEETKILTLLELPRSGIQQIVLTTTRNEYSVGYPVPVAWNFKGLIGVSTPIQCQPTPTQPNLNPNKRCIGGYVELNDGSGQRYISKPVDVHIDPHILAPQTVITDTNGNFIHQIDLDFQALHPNNFWPVGVPYQRPAENTILDPPAHVKYQSAATVANPNPPQIEFETLEPYVILKDRDIVLGKKDIAPLSISPSQISYSFDYRLETFQFPNRPGEEVWFGTVFENLNPHSLNCPTTPGITCNQGIFRFLAGSVTPYVTNPLSGTTFSYDSSSSSNAIFDVGIIPETLSNPGAVGLKLEVLKVIPSEITPSDSGLRIIFAQHFHPVHFIIPPPSPQPPPADIFEDLTFSLSEMEEELDQRFPGQPIEGEYIAKIDIAHPNTSIIYGVIFARFGVDDISTPAQPSLTPLPDPGNSFAPLGGEVHVNSAHLIFVLFPRRTISWKFTSMQSGSAYNFDFDATFNRDPTNDMTIKEGLDHLYYVKSNGEIIQFFTPSNGGIPRNSDTGYSMVLKVPSQATDFYAYTLGIPQTNGNPIDFTIKTWLLNVGDTDIGQTIVYSKRGQRATFSADLLPPAGSLNIPSLAVQPLTAGEIQAQDWQHWYKIIMIGYAMDFQFSVYRRDQSGVTQNIFSATCTGPNSGLTECDPYYASYGSSNYEEWRRCGFYEFCQYIPSPSVPQIPQGGQFRARVDLLNSLEYPSPGTYLPAGADIILWNWYITQTHLWSNQDPHTGRLFTAEPQPYLPARRRLMIT